MEKQVTARDVAKLAGVSPATVSRVISDRGYASPETRAKVEKAIEELGFKVNLSSSRRETKSILMLTSSLRNHANSYYIDGVERAAAEAGYEVLIKQINTAEEHRLQAIRDSITRCRAVGVIFFTDTVEEWVMAEIAQRVPVACMLTGSQISGLTCVNLNEALLMRRMVDYLIGLGKRKIALISGQQKNRRFAKIQQEYLQTLAEYGLERDPTWIINVDTNYFSTTAKILAEHLLKSENPPNAFVAATDIYAAGAICACKKMGYDVPGQVSVIGRDNTAICHVFEPPITAFDIPMEQLGFTACVNLIEQIEKPQYVPKNILMEGHLIIRDSSGIATM